MAHIFSDCQNKFDNDKYQFLALLDETIDLDEIVPASFVTYFHALTGRPRKHLLYPMIKALLIQRIFSIPTDALLIIFLKSSQELRDFCDFDVVFLMPRNSLVSNRISYRTYNYFDKNYAPYKAAYGSISTHADSNQAIQQMYINSHFCYAYKFGIITNGFWIVPDITFYSRLLKCSS